MERCGIGEMWRHNIEDADAKHKRTTRRIRPGLAACAEKLRGRQDLVWVIASGSPVEEVIEVSCWAPLHSFKAIYVLIPDASRCSSVKLASQARGWANVHVIQAHAHEFTPPEGTANLVTISDVPSCDSDFLTFEVDEHIVRYLDHDGLLCRSYSMASKYDLLVHWGCWVISAVGNSNGNAGKSMTYLQLWQKHARRYQRQLLRSVEAAFAPKRVQAPPGKGNLVTWLVREEMTKLSREKDDDMQLREAPPHTPDTKAAAATQRYQLTVWKERLISSLAGEMVTTEVSSGADEDSTQLLEAPPHILDTQTVAAQGMKSKDGLFMTRASVPFAAVHWPAAAAAAADKEEDTRTLLSMLEGVGVVRPSSHGAYRAGSGCGSTAERGAADVVQHLHCTLQQAAYISELHQEKENEKAHGVAWQSLTDDRHLGLRSTEPVKLTQEQVEEIICKNMMMIRWEAAAPSPTESASATLRKEAVATPSSFVEVHAARPSPVVVAGTEAGDGTTEGGAGVAVHFWSRIRQRLAQQVSCLGMMWCSQEAAEKGGTHHQPAYRTDVGPGEAQRTVPAGVWKERVSEGRGAPDAAQRKCQDPAGLRSQRAKVHSKERTSSARGAWLTWLLLYPLITSGFTATSRPASSLQQQVPADYPFSFAWSSVPGVSDVCHHKEPAGHWLGNQYKPACCFLNPASSNSVIPHKHRLNSTATSCSLAALLVSFPHVRAQADSLPASNHTMPYGLDEAGFWPSMFRVVASYVPGGWLGGFAVLCMACCTIVLWGRAFHDCSGNCVNGILLWKGLAALQQVRPGKAMPPQQDGSAAPQQQNGNAAPQQQNGQRAARVLSV